MRRQSFPSPNPVISSTSNPIRYATAAVIAPKNKISSPPAYHFWIVNIVFSAPSTNNIRAVRQQAMMNKIVTLSSPKSMEYNTTYPNSGTNPKHTNEQNVTRPSKYGLSSSPGTSSSSSKAIIRSTKNSLFFDMAMIAVVASSLLNPFPSKISIISWISPSGLFSISHISRARSSSAYWFAAFVERASPTPMLRASANTDEIPRISTTSIARSPPAAPATTANVVMIPSSPPYTIDFK
mmetsp:Transcript_49138/g.111254  ORF Transcript_49138/g.111254 Transcript_49138/m.111254 type:complete len:238 (-) Transcript_49138:185-898(-)